MDISVKAKVVLKLDNRPYQIGNQLYTVVKYKFDKKLFYEESFRITLVDDGIEDWIFDRIEQSQIMSSQEFIKECEGVINNLKGLEERIKEKIIHDTTTNNRNMLEVNSLKELKKSINNIKIKFKISA